MIVVVIVACEVGFWVVLVAGLLTRYGLGWPRTSSALLLCAPLVDLVLLAATVADLRGGAVASAAHGLAAAYLGFSVAFGHRTIQALDQRVAHRFAGAPAPLKPARSGAGRVRYEWQQWRRAALGWAVASTLLVAAIGVVGDPGRTAELSSWLTGLTLALAAWLLAGPVLARARWGSPAP